MSTKHLMRVVGSAAKRWLSQILRRDLITLNETV